MRAITLHGILRPSPQRLKANLRATLELCLPILTALPLTELSRAILGSPGYVRRQKLLLVCMRSLMSHPGLILHAAPPTNWSDMSDLMQGGMIGAALFEGIARTLFGSAAL